MAGHNRVGHPTGHCAAHGKGLYPSRRAAKAGIRRTHAERSRAYPCTAQPGLWHFGRLPDDVITGRRTSHEIYHQYNIAA